MKTLHRSLEELWRQPVYCSALLVRLDRVVQMRGSSVLWSTRHLNRTSSPFGDPGKAHQLRLTRQGSPGKRALY